MASLQRSVAEQLPHHRVLEYNFQHSDPSATQPLVRAFR
jgi:hypothetical protein